MIQMHNVNKSFKEKRILHDVSFTVEKGEVVGLLGPNGAGKTTMIRLMNGVIAADSGTVRIHGLDPLTTGNDIRRMSGVVTESAGLYHDMSAAENLLFFAKLYDVDHSSRRIDRLLEQFRLTEHGPKQVGMFSTGMKKRLAIAKALLHEPEILFLDEPTNGLDPEGIRDMISLLRQVNAEEGTTILICSHVLYQLEDVCDSYLFLDRGRIIERGGIRDLEDKYAGNVMLVVETGYQGQNGQAAGYPYERAGGNLLQFNLTSKSEIPGVLSYLLSQSWVHSARITNRNLEALYFEVRRRWNES